MTEEAEPEVPAMPEMPDVPEMPVDEMDERTAEALTVFGKDVGEWDVELEICPAPGAEVIRTTGVSTSRIVGRRWLITDHTTESGFDGHGVYGWDPVAERYVGIWVDSMGAGFARAEGSWDEASRTMSFDVSVEAEGRTVRYREATTTVDPDTRVYRNIVPTPDGGEHEVIKATYRRR